MPAIATYPGTVTPLRGLNAFAESERDVLFGRDVERDELARLVTSEGFRAGLLYGEPGVGKTSLLRAGLVPHLRDHGVVALVCDDIRYPADAFAYQVQQATGLAPTEGERPVAFLSRVLSQALEGQLYLFILDEVDRVLESADDRVIGELGDLFARVVTRSGGRARFLFSCASASVHLFGLLEKRTGSLFPPSSRFLLERMQPQEAALVLDRTLALAGVVADQTLANSVVEALSRDGAILPADLQIAALALRELGVTSPDQIGRIGGATELERLWISASAAASGDENLALRLLAEIALPRGGSFSPSWAATRAGIDPARAPQAFAAMADKGLVRAIPNADTGDTDYELTHPILQPRVREVAAPARMSARRAFELLGSKAAEGKRLGLREWWALRRERITPSTPDEVEVVARSKRFFLIVAGAVAAVPVILIIVMWISLSGSYYLDTARAEGDGSERVVVRAGKPSLSGFFWLPGSPSYGSVVADTGFTRSMLTDDAWDQVRAGELGGDLDGGGFVDQALSTLEPRTRHLIGYAAGNDPAALRELKSSAKDPDATVRVLEALRPIARGSDDEVQYIETLLSAPSPAVRAAALSVAQDATRRGSKGYGKTLAAQLASEDAEERRQAFSAVQSLAPAVGKKLFADALENNPDPVARRELLAVVTAGAAQAAPSADTAKSVLANKDIGAGTREKARELLRRAFATDANAASQAAAELAADGKAPVEDRVLALELLFDHAPEEVFTTILPDVKLTRRAKSEPVRAAALPLHARIAPKDASADLALMLDKKQTEAMRVAATLAWGEIAKTKDKAAQGALETLIKDSSSVIRAAAARAYGNVGRPAQSELAKMVKKEGLSVAVGAAYGLANSAEQGASAGVAVGGILQLWKRKGRSRREAAIVFARMARDKKSVRSVYSYLASAARSKDDPRLHPVAAEGLCNAMVSGYKRAQRDVLRAASDESLEVRRIAVNCVADHPEFESTATAVATELIDDSSVDIRTEAARVLAKLAEDEKASAKVGEGLSKMIRDSSRDVRVIALRALASMGDRAPAGSAAALVKAFDSADPAEKLELLEAARSIGAADIVSVAMADPSPLVRVAAIDTAISTGTEVAPSLNAALTDDDPSVRRAALERLAVEKDKLDQAAIDRALALAVHDDDPAIGDVALTTFARIGQTKLVVEQLGAGLASRSEAERARVARACMGLVDRGDAKRAVELLEPLITDGSHDVRTAAMAPLAAGYAATNSPEQLAELLRSSETRAMRRLVAAAAFVMLARTDAGRDASIAGLKQVAQGASPMVAMTARLTLGLIESGADGIAFLASIAP